jgi:tetratricopeptide (TPR) repeat protein
MNIYTKAFGTEKKINTKRRTLKNFLNSVFPKDIEYFEEAIFNYESNNLEAAIESITEAINKSTDNIPKYFAFRANVYEDLGRYENAIKDYQKAIEFSISDVDVYALYHQIGFCYLSKRNNEKANEFYSYAINLKLTHPNNELTPDVEGIDRGVLSGIPFKKMYNNRGSALKNLGKLNEALADCNKAMSYDENYSNPYLMASQIYAMAGEEDKALTFLKKSARLGNKNAENLLEEIGVNLSSINSTEVGLNRTKLDECLRATFEQHNLSKGKKISLELIEKGVNDVIPYLCLSAIYATEENWSKCEYFTGLALEIDDTNTMLCNHMGVAICSQSHERILEGLYYFKKGFDLGDKDICGQNFLFWHKKINQ